MANPQNSARLELLDAKRCESWVRHTFNHAGLKKDAFHTHRTQHPGVVHDARRYPHASLGWHDPRSRRCRNDQGSGGTGDELALSVLMGGRRTHLDSHYL
jgi:hypothetical protein